MSKYKKISQMMKSLDFSYSINQILEIFLERELSDLDLLNPFLIIRSYSDLFNQSQVNCTLGKTDLLVSHRYS